MGFVVAPKLLFTAALMVVIWVAVLPLVSSSSSSDVACKVGDDDVIGWSSSKRIFHVGDTIRFEYDPNKVYQHVLLQVTPTAYQLCDATSPIAVYTTGNNSITFNSTGHYYFIFGPGGCVQEQMLDIYIQPEEDQEDHDVVSAAAPTLAQAAVSPSSSSSSSLSSAATGLAASSEPTPSPDDNFDDLTQYILLGAWLFFSVAIVLLASQ